MVLGHERVEPTVRYRPPICSLDLMLTALAELTCLRNVAVLTFFVFPKCLNDTASLALVFISYIQEELF